MGADEAVSLRMAQPTDHERRSVVAIDGDRAIGFVRYFEGSTGTHSRASQGSTSHRCCQDQRK